MMAISKTGSGKTAAFLIPIIEHALKDPRNYTALVVTPTRELALQIEEEFKSLTLGMSLYSATFIGGTNINSDAAARYSTNSGVRFFQKTAPGASSVEQSGVIGRVASRH